MDYEKEKEVEKRKRIIRIVEEGKKSDHWKILEAEIQKLVQRNEKYLENYNKKIFKDEKEVQEHDHTVIATNFMKWFLKLNDKIIEDNLSFFKKMERFVKNTVHRANSFVK